MTTSEPGPELDRRVSEAMGKGPVMVLDSYPEKVCYAPYSTDPARIAEMVEWLNGSADLAVYVSGDVDVYLQGTKHSATGCTIPHALALLVVAVANPAP